MRRAAILLLALIPFVPLTLTAGADAPPADDAPVAYRGARILHRRRAAHRQRRPRRRTRARSSPSAPARHGRSRRARRSSTLAGKTIIPGLVDTHSHIGIYPRPDVPANSDGNEGSGAVQSGLRALDAI